GVKRLRRLAVLAALCGTVAFAGWVGAGFAGLGSLGIESTGAPIEVTSATARAEHVDAPRVTALGEHVLSVAEIASGGAALSDPPPMPQPAAVPVAIASLSTTDPERTEAEEQTGLAVADTGGGNAALSDPPPMPQPPATPPVLFAAMSPTDPVQNAARPTVSSEALDVCPDPDVCIDQYLWSLYERTPKVDTIKVEEQIKVKVKNKGKTRTVVKTLTKYVTEDFGWKDPKAAQKAGMSVKDYVIGGMDRDFRGKLYKALRAMDEAGLSP